MASQYPIPNFKAWIQSTLPSIFDNSLSFYEVLAKLQEALNTVIDAQNELHGEWANIQAWINTQLEIYSKEQLEEWKTDGTLSQILNEELMSQKADKTYVDNKFLESSNPFFVVRRLGAETNDDAAIMRMSDYIEANDGGSVYFEARKYLISKTIEVRTDNVSFTGTPGKTIITAQLPFSIVENSVILFSNGGDAFKSLSWDGININCNQVAAHGIVGIALYDNITFNNVTVVDCSFNHSSFFFRWVDGSPALVCQTVTLNNCISLRPNVTTCNTAGFYFSFCNEFVLTECKDFPANSNDGEIGFYFSNSRGITLINCSSGSSTAFMVEDFGFNSQAIDIYSPTLEGVSKFILVLKGNDGGVPEQCHFIAPRILNSTGKITLFNANKCDIDSSMTKIELYDGVTDNIIRVRKISDITYDGSINTYYTVLSDEWKSLPLANGWTGTLYTCSTGHSIKFKGIVNSATKTSHYIATISEPKINNTRKAMIAANNGYTFAMAGIVFELDNGNLFNIAISTNVDSSFSNFIFDGLEIEF